MHKHRPATPIEAPVLVAIGGFPGAGKSLVAGRLSRELSLPLLASDTTGGTIRDVLQGKVESSDAFRAGYELLFTLAETFLGSGCSVVIDTNMGWEFQWQRLDAIVGRLPEASFVPVILHCPRRIAVERITRRHEESGGTRSTASQIQSVHSNVWDYLERLDRPDARIVDAVQEPDLVYAQAREHLRDLGTPTSGHHRPTATG